MWKPGMLSEETSPLSYQNEGKDEPVWREAFLPYWLKWIPDRNVGLNGKEGRKSGRIKLVAI